MKPFPQICSALLLASVVFSTALYATGAEPDAEMLFVRRVLPLLREKCFSCHGNDKKKIESGLDLRTAAGLRKGGDSGLPSIVAKQPEKSPLYIAIVRIHTDDWEPMPPKEKDKLSPEQIGWIKDWIAGGAPWPGEARIKEITRTKAERRPAK